jgi:hypothetical protein
MDIKNHKYVSEDGDEYENDLLEGSSTLVRVRRGPDTSIFRGWGLKL